MVDFGTLLRQTATPQLLRTIRLGIEREGQRITPAGQLATQALAPALVRQAPQVQRDFAETQLELITPITSSTTAAIVALTRIHQRVQRELAPTELIWPLSMPPALPADATTIPIARLGPAAVAYRHALAQRSGRRYQMICGLHVNFELAPALLQKMWHQQQQYVTLPAFRNAVYLRISQNWLHYQWLLTYLYGCSPISWPHFFDDRPQPSEPLRSIRNSRYGYVNPQAVAVSYESLPRYLADLEDLVTSGKLIAAKEFYGSVRLRGGQQVTDLAQTGIEYLELRGLDLNPLTPIGVQQDQLDFLHVFLLLMLCLPAPAVVDDWVTEGQTRNRQVAAQRPTMQTVFRQEGDWLCQQIITLLAELGLPELVGNVQRAQRILADPTLTLAAQWQRQSGTPMQAALSAAQAAQRTLLV